MHNRQAMNEQAIESDIGFRFKPIVSGIGYMRKAFDLYEIVCKGVEYNDQEP